VYGRERTVEQLARARLRALVLAGDPGVGKSEVLAAAQVRAAAGGAVAPTPVTIRRSPAALQIALLDALGAAVALLARDEGLAKTAARHVADAARRMAKARLDELGSAAGKMLLSAMRAKLGSEIADAIEEFVRDLSTSVDERLAARISAAGDGDVIEVIAGFAAEVAALAGDRDVLLALDKAERLDKDDVRRLADLFTLLPDRVMVRLAYATADQSAQEHLDVLQEAGATVVMLDGLGPDLVARWLADDDVPAGMLGEIMRVTGGYPLHVQDAIAALKAGRSLADLEPDQVIGAGTRRAFRNLDPEVQRAAIMLAAFADPPPRARIPGFLKLDTAAWAVVEQQLWNARILAVEQDQNRWFHELRRRYLWQEIMTEPQRRDAAEVAVTELLALMRDSGAVDPALLVEFARLLPLAGGLLAAEPDTRSMVEAGVAEIAVTASIMELSEPGSSSPVDAEVVLLYAREAFGARDDLVAALRSLFDRGLVSVQPGPNGVVLIPSWADEHAGMAIIGRAARELGRVPVPRVATAVFQAYLRARLGNFTHLQYGVGHPGLADLSKSAFDLHRHRQHNVLMLGRQAPGLLLRADYQGVPVFAAAAYDGAAARDQAIAEIGQLTTQDPGQPVTAHLVRAYPLPRVPCRRFLRAYERLTGTAIGSPLGMLAEIPRLDRPIPASEWAQTQAAVFDFARRATSPEERLAFDLDEPVGVIYVTESGCLIAQVSNDSGAKRVQVSAAENLAGPFSRFQLAHAAGLRTDQRLGRIIFTADSGLYDDPVVTTLLQVSIQAAAFNQHQRLLTINAEQTALQDALTQAAEREAADALALAAALPAGESHRKISSRTTYVLLWTDEQHTKPRARQHLAARWGYIDHEHGTSQEVRVVIQSPTDRDYQYGNRRAFLQQAFGLQPEELDTIDWSVDDAARTIAGMLGFTTTDICLQHP
jgi:hypothetical protein